MGRSFETHVCDNIKYSRLAIVTMKHDITYDLPYLYDDQEKPLIIFLA